MTTFLNPTIELIEENPEVKSFVYQQIADFEAFVTPETVVQVVARDPRKLALQYETEGREFNAADLKKLYRIAIILSEGEANVQAEGVHEDIFEAIKAAKSNLLAQLIEIQDSVISQQERMVEINHFLQPPVIH